MDEEEDEEEADASHQPLGQNDDDDNADDGMAGKRSRIPARKSQQENVQSDEETSSRKEKT